MQIKAKYFTNYYYRNYSNKTKNNNANYIFNFSLQDELHLNNIFLISHYKNVFIDLYQ